MHRTARSVASVLCLSLVICTSAFALSPPESVSKRREEISRNLREIGKALEEYSKSRPNTQDWEKSLEELKEMEKSFKN